MAGKRVKAPNGNFVALRDKEEVDFFNARVSEYSEFQSEHPTDADILTQMIFLQTLNFRYMNMLSDMEDDEILEIKEVNKMVKENTAEINKCADQLRLTKKYRDAGKESIAEFLKEIQTRALLYNETIDRMADKSISNMKKMKTILRLRKVCDQEERFKMHITNDEDIFVLFEKLIAEFEEIDKPLLEEQKSWWLEGNK